MRKAIAVPLFIFIALALGVFWGQPLHAASIKDSESTTHGFDAAAYQVVNTYDYPGFKVIQLTLPVLSHYSYFLVSGGQALVVDPGRDIQTYLEIAAKNGLTIRGVFLTHSHADFVAGHTEMAKAAGCPIFSNASSGAEYPHQPVKEGSTIPIGEATLRIVETPGHTPDGLCGYVFGSRKPASPDAIFTGDTLFVGSVGRPDLMGGTISAAALASMLYDTWTQKLSKAGDGVVIFPAHGAGSLCGAHLSDQPYSTLGAEKKSNSYLQFKTRSDFIAAVLDGLPEAPQYFKHNAAMNRKGPDLINWETGLPEAVEPRAALQDSSQYQVIDLRDAAQYAAGHIPNAVNIGIRGRMETWVGIMVPWGSSLVLCGSKEETVEAGRRLHRVGYRAAAVSMESWKKANLPVVKSSMVAPRDLYAQMQKGQGPVVVDVRLPNEWMGIRIGMVVNLPLNHLTELTSKLDPSQPVLTVCNSAYRSSMAVGVLERQGFKHASSLAGGSEAWLAAGLPVYGAEVQPGKPAAAAPSPVRDVKLPERMGPSDLRRLIQDLPGTFDLIDIRPASQFADFSIQGSRNVDIADALKDPSFLTGAGPLIFVDRDGSLAMAVGGILSQKSQRVIKVLYGGLQSYWDETEKQTMMGQTQGGGSFTLGVPTEKSSTAGPLVPAGQPALPPPGPSQGVLPAQPATEQQTPPPSQPAKPKSAGC
jgi:hydroxyacylglutathione hydrolase